MIYFLMLIFIIILFILNDLFINLSYQLFVLFKLFNVCFILGVCLYNLCLYGNLELIIGYGKLILINH